MHIQAFNTLKFAEDFQIEVPDIALDPLGRVCSQVCLI